MPHGAGLGRSCQAPTKCSGAALLFGSLARAMVGIMVDIRSFETRDLPGVVDLSLRAWAPVFESLRATLGDEIFLRLHPDWKAGQAESVAESCTNEERDAFVAVLDDRPVGFVTVALNAFHEGMGVIDIIGVDPDHQRTGVAAALTSFALDHMRKQGMDIAVVETGGDPGHAPARATYEATGFTRLPIARYFQLLTGDPENGEVDRGVQ